MMNKDFNDMVMKFDNGDSFTIGETYEKVLNKLNACKEINFCSDIEVDDDELYGSSISFSTNNMIKDYLCNFVLGFENEKKLEDICVGFDIHDFIKRNGGYPENYDYMAWLDFCIKVENDIKKYVDELSDKVEIVRKWHHDYRVRIGNLIYTVGHGREYETGIYLYIRTVESYEDEYGKIEEPYIE